MEHTETQPPPPSLSQRLKGAAAWTASGHVLAQSIKLVSNLWMTHLLVPGDFGLMAIVGMLLVGVVLISDVGISQSLITNPKGAERAFRNTVWTFQIVRGVGGWLLSCVIAAIFWAFNQNSYFPPGSVYADDRLPLLIVGTFSQMAIQGFQSTQIFMTERNVSAKEMTLLRIYSQVIALIPMFLVAWYFRSVWALVAGGVAASLTQVILSHIMLKGERDHFAWDTSVLKEIWSFGRWILISSTITFLASSGDRILLGHYVDATSLGLYAIAGLLLAPVQSIYTMMVSSVVFPGISEVNRLRPHDLPRSYQRFQRYMDAMAGVGAGLLWMAGPAIVKWLYKDSYEAAGPMLSILAFSLMGLRFYVVEQVYIAKGQTMWLTAANVLRLIALIFLVPVGFHLNGMTGAVIGATSAYFMSWPLALYFRHKNSLGGWRADHWLLPAFAAGSLAGYLLSSVLATLPRIQH